MEGLKLQKLIDELTQDITGINSFHQGFSMLQPTVKYDIELDGHSIDKERLDKILLLINEVRDKASFTITITYD